MKEVVFLKKNADRWEQFEQMLRSRTTSDPDKLAELFVQITDDLSFARTFYPSSKTTQYLNGLALKAHQAIYKRKREEKNRFIRFWKYEVPQQLFLARKELFFSCIIFGISMLIGIVSAVHDDQFVRLIMGDTYVNMTLDNIERGDPLAVYKMMHETTMFFGITFNNIMVSFYTFAMGMLLSFGTAYSLFSNGVMLGSFQYFFYEHDLLFTSILTIWIHGTLEISAIVIAGAAGLTMGNSILFPGTYTRIQSLMVGAKRGLKIIIGLVPIFIIAGFLESFITRKTEWPDVLKAFIILSSLAFVIWYFVIYPYNLNKRTNHDAGTTDSY